MSADPFLDFARASKAEHDRIHWLLNFTTVRPEAVHRDHAVRLHRNAASRYWHRLPAVCRAAVLNPSRRG